MNSHDRRLVLRKIIFGTDTPAGKTYDVILILTVILSVFSVMLDSIESVHNSFGSILSVAEWFFTILLTIDYTVRLACTERPVRYATSFWGIIDLLGVIPTYLSLMIPGGRYLVNIRFLRVLRIFRVLKLVAFLQEAMAIIHALRECRRKIIVFLLAVLTMVVVLGSLMYVIEGQQNGFTSIPRSIYWAIVTLTTVGYGDISPGTPLGQTLAALVMILGYSIIVVPTGIVTVEMVAAANKATGISKCRGCGRSNHENDAVFCKICGTRLEDADQPATTS